MLPRHNRISKTEIPELLRHGKRIRCGIIDLVTAPTHGDSQFAFIVSSSVDKRATVRNRVKRVLRESVRLLLPSVRSGKRAVFIARAKLPREAIMNQGVVRDALAEANML